MIENQKAKANWRVRLKRALLFGAVGIIALTLLFNARLNTSLRDRFYIDKFINEWGLKARLQGVHASFETQIAFISTLQDSTLYQIRSGDAPFEEASNMKYLYENRKGVCFNRAFFQEKILREAGFKTRHVYIYFTATDKVTHFRNFFKKGLRSHAMFEVKTKRGWMLVGTNANWLGLDKNRTPLTIGDVRRRLKGKTLELAKIPTKGKIFYEELRVPHDFRFIYGIYSRHGKFLKSGPLEQIFNRPLLSGVVPDFNFRELLYNF
ncbi:MAG: hypothetical protein RJA57_1845 [Bacteroidota bacterium]